jgi:Uncharacterized protein conserved in bacteria
MIKRPKAPQTTPRVERIRTFDLMRGLFLIIILLNHLSYYPSGLDIITGRSMMYVSAAEGFFLISGIVLGLVRGRKLLDQPFKKSTKLILKRGLRLYIEACLLTLLFTVIGWMFANNPGLKYGIASPDTPFLAIVWNTLTLSYSYGWADFLRYYAVFLTGAPIVLWLLRRGLWYVVVVISILIWSLYPLTPGGENYIELSWQVIFYAGMIIGFYWPELTNFWRAHFSRRTRIIISRLLFASFITTAIANFILVFGALFWNIEPLKSIHYDSIDFFEKDRMTWRRLLLGTVWFWGFFVFMRRHERLITQKLGKLLTPLGTNSLYVYTIESFVVFFAHLFIAPAQPLVQILPWYINLVISIAAIALVWLAVHKRFLFKIIPR